MKQKYIDDKVPGMSCTFNVYATDDEKGAELDSASNSDLLKVWFQKCLLFHLPLSVGFQNLGIHPHW